VGESLSHASIWRAVCPSRFFDRGHEGGVFAIEVPTSAGSIRGHVESWSLRTVVVKIEMNL